MSNKVFKGSKVYASGDPDKVKQDWVTVEEASKGKVRLCIGFTNVLMTTDQARSFAALIMNTANAADQE